MNVLNDPAAMKILDTRNVLASIEQLDGQCQQAWEEVGKIAFPDSYRNVSSIVFSGMGGSALGAYVLKSLFFDQLPLPFDIVNDYHLPPYVGPQTLVIIASYSGSTEETLSTAREAIEKKTQVTGLTTGGKLAEMFMPSGIPFYKIDSRHNPANQPRLGTGYSVFGQMALLQTIGILNISGQDREETLRILKAGNTKYGVSAASSNNPAKQLASSWIEKIPIVVAAEHLAQVGRVVRNQIHETAKSYADYHVIPELNHHLMEGLTNPKTNKATLRFLFIESSLYSKDIQKRIQVTKDVVGKQGIAVDSFTTTASCALAQAFETIQFCAYVNYYMAMSYNLDPSKISWVDFFKAELAK